MLPTIADLRSWWAGLKEDPDGLAEQVPADRLAGAVMLASGLALFAELVMIRWHATSAHVFAIFKNVSLLSCFLGLGIGFALSSRKRLIGLGTFLPLLAVQVVLFGLIASTIGGARVNPVAEQLVMGLRSSNWSWLHAVGGNLFLVAIFALNAAMFIPLGYLTGGLMGRLPALQAYSLNLIGSLLGIGLFFALSLLWAPPIVWIGVTVLLACPFLLLDRNRGVAMVCTVVCFLALGMMGKSKERMYYSPYQTISLQLPRPGSGPAHSNIKVNHAFFQDVIDCSPAAVSRHKDLADSAAYYDLPAKVRPRLGDVLVVGAGAGNDVASALRNGAKTVTAVEIDPAIQFLGSHIHPERPYQDERTKVVINDARTYLRQTGDRFDTIVYGLLDSHTNLGAMTNVRLDSFVYTVEAFREAVARLNDDGLLVVSYLVMDQSQADKLFAMLSAVYPDREPRVFHSIKGYTYVTGPGLKSVPDTIAGVTEVTAAQREKALAASPDLATDDWPYFYMQKRTYPVSYAAMIVLLLAVSGWMVKARVGSLSVGSYRNGAFFFLGAGFMLIETKVITELGLTFGNTWSVSAVAITAILGMGFLANLWVMRRGPVPLVPAFVLLGVTLVAGLVLARAGVVLPFAKLSMPAVLTLPLFFAGLIFSTLLKDGAAHEALSANLFGAMLGGLLEYNSMYWGLASLYPVGLLLYGMALVCLLADRPATAAVPAAPDVPHRAAA